MQYIKPNDLQAVADFIYQETGIVYNKDNFFALEKRIKNIIKSENFDNIEPILAELKVKGSGGNIALRQLLLDSATNNETSFFRDRGVFLKIRDSLVPELMAEGKVRQLNVWSAACATGQEVYTLAMVLNEVAGRSEGFRFSLLASDISKAALDKAKDGTYSQLEVQRGLPAPMMIKNFDRLEDRAPGVPAKWRVKQELKKNISFRIANLLKPAFVRDMHLVLLRNVLIYHDMDNRIAIIKSIFNAMNPAGFLILGSAERVVGIETYFESVSFGNVLVYKRHAAPKFETAKHGAG